MAASACLWIYNVMAQWSTALTLEMETAARLLFKDEALMQHMRTAGGLQVLMCSPV